MSNIVSYTSWVQIIIQFDEDKLEILKDTKHYLYLFQGINGTNPNNCTLSFGASIDLSKLNSTTLNIMVDQWPFWLAAYADRDSFSSNWHSQPSAWFSNESSVKQSLIFNCFEIDSQGDSSPKIFRVAPNPEINQFWDDYTFGLFNKTSDSFYIGVGRAFQWSQNNEDINNYDWETMIGCNCFLFLDSNSNQYWHSSNEIILLISPLVKNNGAVLKQLSGYSPCYFKLKEKKRIDLYYDDNGWKNISTKGEKEFKVFDQLDQQSFFNLLIHSSSSPFLQNKKPTLQYGNKIWLCTSTKKDYITSAKYESLIGGDWPPKYYYPQINSLKVKMPIELILSGGNGNLKDGDTVRIETTEESVGNENILGAWRTPSLYYYKEGWGEQQQWTIRKKNNDDPVIYYGDEVYFVNNYYKEKWLCVKDFGLYLTIEKTTDAYWLIDQP